MTFLLGIEGQRKKSERLFHSSFGEDFRGKQSIASTLDKYGLRVWVAHNTTTKTAIDKHGRETDYTFQYGQLSNPYGYPAISVYEGYKYEGNSVHDEYWVGGLLHRVGGPAIDGKHKEWRVMGLLHRKDGPAVIYGNGVQEWWLNGEKYATVYCVVDAFKHVLGNQKAMLLKLKYDSNKLVSDLDEPLF